ncbi:MAG: glycoside hydrolase family 13 protein [Romboutsia sp.]
MRSVINYNSWNKDFKAPFGALKINEKMKIVVKENGNYQINNITLVIFREDIEIQRLNLKKEDLFTVEFDGFEEVGVYFYHFEVDIVIDGYEQRLFYGKNNNNAEAVEYSYDWINKYQITVYEDFKTPSWYKEGILYHIFVDRFNNGNRTGRVSNPKSNSFIYANWKDEPMYIKDQDGSISRWDFYGGNLKGIIHKLPYIKKLGVSIIYLSPIFESSSNHKYDTGDYKTIDPMFGDEEILKELIDKAAQKGISIMLDGVFSHTGADSKYFNKYGRYDTVGAYQSQESKYSNWYTFKNHPENYKCWWDIKALPNTNELEPSFMDYIIYDEDSVIKKWTGMGVKGWRLDVADELPSKFIKEMKKELREVDEDAILVGEVWEDASNKVSYGERRSYFLGKELDAAMGYPFRDNIVRFLKGEISSNDLNNAYMVIKENYPKESFKSNLNLIGTHDVNRIKTELNKDKSLVKLAVATQMTFEGVPYVYYGDEAGLEGKTDPDNRRAYPWKNEDEDMIDFYRNLTTIRNKNKSLVSGDTIFIDTNNNDVFGYIRFDEENRSESILVLLNRSENLESLSLNIEGYSLEEIEYKTITKKYVERIFKESNVFNVDIEDKSCLIFTLLKN